jgi:hypothetical protein
VFSEIRLIGAINFDFECFLFSALYVRWLTYSITPLWRERIDIESVAHSADDVGYIELRIIRVKFKREKFDRAERFIKKAVFTTAAGVDSNTSVLLRYLRGLLNEIPVLLRN